ncbi:MAG: peptide chain release factor-like protein [bacterium]|nr:MAG: peptide chain release factor-like protein [bacterium]
MDLGDLKKQCRITTFRASGPGGQHKNVTDSAVRLQHLPTGIVVIGRRHRSQHRNMEDALERLAHRIEESKKVPRKRVPTRKSKAVRTRELEAKKKRGQMKKLRGKVMDR